MNKIFKIANSFLKKGKKEKTIKDNNGVFTENGKRYKLMIVGIEVLKVELK